MSVPMSQVLTTARTYLNDDNATQFPDPVLIPKVQEAHRELQTELWTVGSPLVRAQTAVLHYIAFATTLPALPGDFLCPTMLFETAWPTVLPWIPMTEAFFIPLTAVVGATINFWAWQQEAIVILGANVDRSVIIQYRRQIPIPQVATDLIGVLFGESFLAPRAAAIAAGTVGGEAAVDKLTSLAKENLSKVIAANRGQQRPLSNPGGATGWPKEGGGRDK